jgi:dTDP-glucose 4,6-dehydratase
MIDKFRDELINSSIDRIMPFIPEESGLPGASFFITGGTGFIGTWLLKTLLRLNDARRLGISITVLSRNPGKFAKSCPEIFSRVRMIHGDVTEFDFPHGEFAYVVHAATDTDAGTNRSAPIYLLDSIVLGTKRVMEFAARRGCRKLLYVSSGAVYGTLPENMSNVGESYMGAPDAATPTGNCLYGGAKRAAELIASLYAKQYGFEAKIARLFAFVGPYLPKDSHFAAGNFIADLIEERPIIIKGDGTPLRSYMYAADAALWMLKILYDAPGSRPYNVGSDVSLTIEDLAGMIAGLKRPRLEVKIMRRSAYPQKDIYVPSVRRARDELGLELYFTLDEALRLTAEWRLNKNIANPEGKF